MKKMILVGFMSMGLTIGGAVGFGAIKDGLAAEDTPASQQQTVSEGKEKLLEREEVQSIALSVVDGKIESIELEDDNNAIYYEVDVNKEKQEFELHIDAYTGEVLKTEENSRDDDWKADRPAADANVISEQEAKTIAEKHTDGDVVELEREEEDEKLIYEIELSTADGEVDMDIDAHTGEILNSDYDEDRWDD